MKPIRRAEALYHLITRALVLTLLLLACGCGAIPVALSPSSSPLAPGVRGSIPASGTDCQYHLFGFLPLSPRLSTQKALSAAKESAGVDSLTDVTVDFKAAHFVLFTSNCVTVDGLGVPRS